MGEDTLGKPLVLSLSKDEAVDAARGSTRLPRAS